MNNQLDKLRHNFFEILKSILENIDIENIDDILDNRDNDEFSEMEQLFNLKFWLYL